MQNTFPTALRFVLNAEGGFSDDFRDSGGATNMGIEQGEYDAHRRACGEVTQSVRYITVAEASNIYHNNYWTPINGDALAYPIDFVVFDTAVNMGVVTAIHMLAEALGLPETSSVTEAMIDKVNVAAESLPTLHALKEAFLHLRIARYHAIVAEHAHDAGFLNGWLRRVSALDATS